MASATAGERSTGVAAAGAGAACTADGRACHCRFLEALPHALLALEHGSVLQRAKCPAPPMQMLANGCTYCLKIVVGELSAAVQRHAADARELEKRLLEVATISLYIRDVLGPHLPGLYDDTVLSTCQSLLGVVSNGNGVTAALDTSVCTTRPRPAALESATRSGPALLAADPLQRLEQVMERLTRP